MCSEVRTEVDPADWYFLRATGSICARRTRQPRIIETNVSFKERESIEFLWLGGGRARGERSKFFLGSDLTATGTSSVSNCKSISDRLARAAGVLDAFAPERRGIYFREISVDREKTEKSRRLADSNPTGYVEPR